MRSHRFVGLTPGVIDGVHIQRMGKAARLFDFFVKWQSKANGFVYGGHPISYKWIRDRIENPPPAETLKKWVARLRREGYIVTSVYRFGRTVVGFTVKILRPKKWALQLSLFPPAPSVVEMKRSEDLVDRRRTTSAAAASIPAPRSILVANRLEQKAQRLEREIRDILSTYAASLEMPQHAEEKIRDRARELELTRYALRQLNTFQRVG